MAAPKGNKFNQKGETVMTSALHCRVTPESKAQFVRQANAEGLKLCAWVMKTLKANS